MIIVVLALGGASLLIAAAVYGWAPVWLVIVAAGVLGSVLGALDRQ